MSELETVRYELTSNGVATITLARPHKHNAMNAQMIDELSLIVTRISEDKLARVCVLQGEGKTFCAGGDLGWMQTQMEQNREDKMAGAGQLAKMLAMLDDLPCPLIGKIQGPAFGGGIGLMAVCDVVIAADAAKFALTETRLGLIPATIGPFVVRRIGEAWARQYFFSAKTFDTDIALKMNLVSVIASGDELDMLVEKEVASILNCQPGAVAEGKALVKTLARNPTMETQQYTAAKLADRWESEEAQNAIAAFFAKRK